MSNQRPAGITILAILEIIFGLIGLTASVVIIGLPSVVSALPRIGALLSNLGLVIGISLLGLSMTWLATGIGFLRGRSWARLLAIILNIVSMLGAVGALASGLITGGIGAIIFWSYMTYYLTRTHIKRFFGEEGSINSSLHLPYPVMAPVAPQHAATLETGNGSNHLMATGSQGSKSTPSCPNCGSRLTMGSPKCLTCGVDL